ncbi:MAG TPA: hypothetical protein DGT21_18445 [Armatimonadetes bacterium]|nr:hypothetical protein [Armatimonadota bacterium]
MTQLHRDLRGPAIDGFVAWDRRRAQAHRPGRVFTGLYVAGCAAALALGYLTIRTHQNGLPLLAATGVVLLSATAVAMLWLCTPGGERLVNAVADRTSRRTEPTSVVDFPGASWVPDGVPSWVWLSLVFCILVQTGLSVLGVVPAVLMQPLSIIWAVPLLYHASGRFFRRFHPLKMLWPGLYGVHAVLVLLGLPLSLGSPLQGLDILMPGAVYGLIACAAAQAHRHLALQHTRAIARSPQTHRCVRGQKHVRS